MAVVKPFKAYRPAEGLAAEIAALPYDVYSRSEAAAYVAAHPGTFLAIDRAESQFPDDVDTYDERVYDKASSMLEEAIAAGRFVQDSSPCYYVYQQSWQGRTQTGIVGCVSIDDYLNDVVRKHENTVEAKEQDRIHHVDTTGMQTGPIFLTYRDNEAVAVVMNRAMQGAPVYDFTSEGAVENRVWVIDDPADVAAVQIAFEAVPTVYIADGHHRAASAVKVGLKRRQEHPSYTGEEEFNTFLSVLFPESELEILAYNRVIKDMSGQDKDDIMLMIKRYFNVKPYRKVVAEPAAKGEIGMYINGNWYMLSVKSSVKSGNPVDDLDVSILQRYVLGPIFKIKDPRTDPKIQFVGGIRGNDELVRLADEYGTCAFSMYPTSIHELLTVADAGQLMPPKSTWFEPKLLSGLFLHKI